MAVAVVTFVGAGKAIDAESVAGFNTGSVDTDIFLEGASSIGVKTSNTTVNMYDSSLLGGPYDFSVGGTEEGEHIFGYMNATTPVSTHAIIIGDTTGGGPRAYWDVGPPGSYSGGWINYVISPAEDFTGIQTGTGWTTTGNPAQLTNINEMGCRQTTSTTIMGNFNNTLVDAFSVGFGYRITRGDGADPDAIFADFITFEETTANRYGALQAKNGILFPLCQLIIGDAGTLDTDFTDDGFTVVWPDALVAADFYALKTEQGTGTTNVVLSNGILKTETSAQAGKILFDFSGVTSANLTALQIKGARLVVLDSACTIDSCDITTAELTQGTAEIDASTIRTESAANVAVIDDATFGTTTGIHDTDFVWTSGGHAIQISGASPTVTLTNIGFSGYGADDTSSSAIWVTATGTTTINIDGGSNPTVRNTGGGTVNVVNSVAVTITVKDIDDQSLVSGAFVHVEVDSGGDLPYQESVTIATSGTTATVTHAGHGLATGDLVKIRGANETELNITASITVTDANTYTYTITSIGGAPGTGSITSTYVVIHEDTTAGIADNPNFAYTANQPITGVVRQGDVTPYYKQGIISGTITSGGFDQTVLLVKDQ